MSAPDEKMMLETTSQWTALIGGLLQIDPAARFTAHKALATQMFATADTQCLRRRKSVSRDASPSSREYLRGLLTGAVDAAEASSSESTMSIVTELSVPVAPATSSSGRQYGVAQAQRRRLSVSRDASPARIAEARRQDEAQLIQFAAHPRSPSASRSRLRESTPRRWPGGDSLKDRQAGPLTSPSKTGEPPVPSHSAAAQASAMTRMGTSTGIAVAGAANLPVPPAAVRRGPRPARASLSPQRGPGPGAAEHHDLVRDAVTARGGNGRNLRHSSDSCWQPEPAAGAHWQAAGTDGAIKQAHLVTDVPGVASLPGPAARCGTRKIAAPAIMAQQGKGIVALNGCR